MQFKTDLITYNGVYRTIQTEKLNLPTSEGRRTILANHMPIMIPLQIGIIETDEDGVLRHYATNGGVLYFRDNEAEIVSDTIMDVERHVQGLPVGVIEGAGVSDACALLIFRL